MGLGSSSSCPRSLGPSLSRASTSSRRATGLRAPFKGADAGRGDSETGPALPPAALPTSTGGWPGVFVDRPRRRGDRSPGEGDGCDEGVEPAGADPGRSTVPAWWRGEGPPEVATSGGRSPAEEAGGQATGIEASQAKAPARSDAAGAGRAGGFEGGV